MAGMDDLMTTGACTLPTPERPLRLAEFDDLFSSSARAVTREDHRARIHLVGQPGLRDRVRDLAERESECCSFFTFVIEGTDRDLTLDVSVPPARHDNLDALATRSELLAHRASS